MKRLFTARQILAQGKAPEWIMWMPGGTHEISCGEVQEDGTVKPVKESVRVTAADAARLQRQLAALMKQNARPFLDFDHAGGEASGWPEEFVWREAEADAPAGIYVRVEWADRGAQLVAGKGYRYFSPEWVLDEKGKVHLPQSGPLGGLVNNPAFREIRRIARHAENGGTEGPQITQISADSGREDPAGKGGSEPEESGQKGSHNNEAENMNKKLIAALMAAGVLSSEAEAADEAAVEKVVQRLQAKTAGGSAEKLKPEEETETVKQLRAQLAQVQRGAARTFVASLVSAGKLLPKDEAGAKAWEEAHTKDPEATEVLAKTLRAAAVMADLGTGAGKAAGEEVTPDAEKLQARGARLQAKALKLVGSGAAPDFDTAWSQAEAEEPAA